MAAKDRDDIREAYAAAIAKSSHEANLRASYTAAYLQASVLIAAASAFPPAVLGLDDGSTTASLVGAMLAFLGVVLTGVVYSLVENCGVYHRYWMGAAYDLEGRLSDEVRLVRDGFRLREPCGVEAGGRCHRLGGAAKWPAWKVLKFAFLLFGGIFVGLVAINIVQLVGLLAR